MKSKVPLLIILILVTTVALSSCRNAPVEQPTTISRSETTLPQSTATETQVQTITDNLSYTFDKSSSTLTIIGDKSNILTAKQYGIIQNDIYKQNLKVETLVICEGIKKVENYAFSDNSDLKKIIIPASLTEAEEYAFSGCKNLLKVEVHPNNLNFKADEKGVLFNASLTDLIVYPAALPDKEYTVPESVVTIHNNAFYICPNLRALHLSPNLKGTFTHWFHCCDNLEKVTVPTQSLNYYSDEQGVIYTKDTKKIVFVPANLRTLVLSENANSFFTHSMINNELITEIILDNTTLNMEDYVYQFVNLKKFTINGNHPDYSCLDGVLYNKDGTKLIWYPPMKEQKTFRVPDTVEYICNVRGKFVERIITSDSVKKIDDNAFLGCDNLKYVHLGKNFERFDYNDEFSFEGENIFAMCEKLQEITVDSKNSNFEIDKYGALCTKGMKDIITLPADGKSAEYVINEKVTKITNCFENCKNLKKLYVGSNVEHINIGEADTETVVCFLGCISLEEVTVSEKNQYYTSEDGILYNKNKTRLCLYPANRADEEFTIPDSVEFVNDFAFNDNRNLKRIYAGTYTSSNLIFNFTDYQKNFQLPIDIYYSCKKEDFPHDYLRDNPNIHFESNELPGK